MLPCSAATATRFGAAAKSIAPADSTNAKHPAWRRRNAPPPRCRELFPGKLPDCLHHVEAKLTIGTLTLIQQTLIGE